MFPFLLLYIIIRDSNGFNLSCLVRGGHREQTSTSAPPSEKQIKHLTEEYTPRAGKAQPIIDNKTQQVAI